jgi:hypothetical protein
VPQTQNPTTTESGWGGVSRRTVTGAAAWALPAIVFTTSSPAAAVSIRGAFAVEPSTLTIDASTPASVTVTTAPEKEGVALDIAVEPEGALTWAPDPAVTLAGAGSVAITFSTTLVEATEATVTVNAVGFESVVFPVVIAGAASVLTLATPGAPVNRARNLPMLDRRQGVSAHVTRRDGSPVEGETVTLTAPAGITFADGRPTFIGTTDASGTVTATLVAPDDATAAIATLAATSRYAQAALDLIVIGPEQVVGFDLPAVAKSLIWDFPADVWIAVPERVTDNAKDAWHKPGGVALESGSWITAQVASSVGWVHFNPTSPKDAFELLAQEVPARAWAFVFRNISGIPGQSLTMLRREWGKDLTWVQVGAHPFTLS